MFVLVLYGTQLFRIEPRTVAIYALTVRAANHLLYRLQYCTDWIAKNVNLFQSLKEDTTPIPVQRK
jgi:hypothetical protein